MYEVNHIEAINSTLKAINTSLERLGFNGAVEGLAVAVRDVGSEISNAIHSLAHAV